MRGYGDQCGCPRSKRKTTRAINTKLGARILCGKTSACIEPEVKRSKVKVTGYELKRAAVVGMHVDMTVHCFYSFICTVIGLSRSKVGRAL